MEQKISLSNDTLPERIHYPADTQISGKIKVTIRIPTGIADGIKQQKINRIYGILSSENPQ